MKTTSKYELRQKFRAIRSGVSAKNRELAAHQAAKILIHQAEFKNSEFIACYLPYKDEFDSLQVIEAIWLAKKQCYLPVLSKKDKKSLYFVPYVYGDPLHLNQYSILEPVRVLDEIAPMQLDLVITPLIAFDKHGHRLGTGGGYYDRTFEFLHKNPSHAPHMVGLGYAAQEAQSIPSEEWDIKLEGVVTEKGYIKCGE